MSATPASLGLMSSQFNWAVKVVAVVKRRGLPVRAAHIAIATCLTESGLKMYANGNNPRSLQLPHDAIGWDHGSVGLFQQQVGGAANSTANWGTTDQCMDVTYSTNAFLTALTRFSWEAVTNWDAAQRVQGSFDPTGGNYRVNDAHAIQIGNALWATDDTPTPAPVPAPVPAGHTPSGTRYTVRQGDTLASIAHKYPDADITWQFLQRVNGIANANVIRVGQVIWIRPPAAPSVPPKPPLIKAHSVAPGENLSTIASNYHTSVVQLVAWNKAKYPSLASNSNFVQIGWVLRVG